MSRTVLAAAASLRKALAGFDPEVISGRDSAHMAEELAATEKACAAARLLAASRAVASGTHKGQGFSDGPSWLARHAGLTPTEARHALGTATRLESCPATKEALLWP